MKESVNARRDIGRTNTDTAFSVSYVWSLYKTKNSVVNLTQEVLILYAMSRTLVCGGCVHITSSSQNQSVLPKKHDYSPIFFSQLKSLLNDRCCTSHNIKKHPQMLHEKFNHFQI